MPKRSARPKQNIIKYVNRCFWGFVILSITFMSFLLPASAAEAGVNSSGTPIMHKAILHIISERTYFDDRSCLATASGDAVATIDGQDSKLEADSIVYDRSAEILEASGNVRIIRHSIVTTGSKYRFKAASDEYLVTVPGTELNEVRISSRRVYPPKNSHSFTFTKGKIDPIVGFDLYSFRPSHIFLGSRLEDLHITVFGKSIYRSTCANSFFHRPVNADDWGRDRFGIGSLLYGSPLNQDVDFLGFGTCSVIVHRAKTEPFLLEYLDLALLPAINESSRQYTEPRELRPVGQTARSIGREKTTKLIWDKHEHVLKILPKDPIECPVLQEYLTLTSPPMRKRGVPQLNQIVAFHEMLRNRGMQYSDLAREQHKDVELSGDAQ